MPSRPLRSLKELKQIPLTTKDDLRRCSPFSLICVPRKEIYQYHETYGTTGAPVSTWFTKQDLRDNAEEITLCGVNFNANDTVLVRFPYAISAVAHMVHAAAQAKGACVIPVSARSTVSPFPRVVNLMRDLQVSVLTCLPLQVLLIAETAELLGMKPGVDFPHLRAICTAGESLSPARRRLLQNIWGVPIFDFYGMAEIGTAVVDCEYGKPHALEDYFIFELLGEDLKTDVKPGQVGRLVITTLRKRAAPMIRYLTGDRTRVVAQECSCGQSASLEVRGRWDDAVVVGGRTFDLWDLDEIVSNLPYQRFWVVGPISGGLHFVVEDEENGGSIGEEPVSLLAEKYRVKLKLELVPKGTLYDRNELLDVGLVGKPQYIYSAAEMEAKKYLQSMKM
jgi:phenylacetate-CoA ligase